MYNSEKKRMENQLKLYGNTRIQNWHVAEALLEHFSNNEKKMLNIRLKGSSLTGKNGCSFPRGSVSMSPLQVQVKCLMWGLDITPVASQSNPAMPILK